MVAIIWYADANFNSVIIAMEYGIDVNVEGKFKI
jgi:hypothetical protein